MKRTYQGYAGGAPATPAPAVPGGAQPAYNYSAAPQQGYQPPLPPGPPPPQPQQQQYGQHQQYPGYGYGGQQQQQPPAQQQQPQQSYASYYQQHQPAAASAPPAAATQQPQYPGYGYGGGQAQQHQQAGQQQYPNYGYGGPPQQHQPKVRRPLTPRVSHAPANPDSVSSNSPPNLRTNLTRTNTPNLLPPLRRRTFRRPNTLLLLNRLNPTRKRLTLPNLLALTTNPTTPIRQFLPLLVQARLPLVQVDNHLLPERRLTNGLATMAVRPDPHRVLLTLQLRFRRPYRP